MAIAVASIGSLGDTVTRSVYTCEVTGSPSANNLVLVGVNTNDAAGTVFEPSSVSGLGMVFSLVTSSVSFDPSGSGALHNLSLWASASPSPSGSIVSIAFSAGPNGAAVVVHECSGVSTSGTSGTKAYGQSVKSFHDTVNNSTITVRAAASAVSTANAWFSIAGMGSQPTPDTAGQNWTQLDSASFSGNATVISSAWTGLSTGTTAVWSSVVTTRRAAIIVELIADNPVVAGTAVAYQRQSRQPDRLPPVPVSITGDVRTYLTEVVRRLNAEAYISKFSGTDPNLSNITGIPGNLVVNVGSASTWTRMWQMSGSIQSIATTGWKMMRMA